jgi:2-iminobutanoate/2-iminopropanoate deaminase
MSPSPARRPASVLAALALCAAAAAGCQQTAPSRLALNPSRPIGPYSGGIVAGPTLFASGQIGVDPRTNEIVEGGTPAQVKQALVNVGAVLRSGNLDYRDVVSATVYLADMADYDVMNKVYAGFFREPYPARTTVAVKDLPRGAKVEISVIAVAGGAAGLKASTATPTSREDIYPDFAD